MDGRAAGVKDIVGSLPGIETVRTRFLALLKERQGTIAHHAVTAWNSTDPKEVRNNLESAQNILHKISGTAGSLGFAPLGCAARDCENGIIDHIEGINGNMAAFPQEIINRLDIFISLSQSVLNSKA